jgi:acyl-CoA thioesterase-1
MKRRPLEKRQDLPSGIGTAIEFNTYEVPAELGIAMPAQAAACVLNITEEQFLSYVRGLAAKVDQDARMLLTEPDLATAIDRLPLRAGSKVMAIGDSVTTYRRSYVELLRAMTALRRPNDAIQFVNHAQSGYTSTHARRATYLKYIKEHPDLVLMALGGNDCERFGSSEAPTLVSPDEYRKNMEAILRAFRDNTSAHLVVLTPVPVMESMLKRVADFAQSQLTWRNQDLQVCADTLSELAIKYDLPLVNLMDTFGMNPPASLYLPDGLHPGSAGQQLILRQLLKAIAM